MNGRLGNQLFQYAFAVALSKKLNTSYVIDDRLVVDSVKKYFERINITDNQYLRRIVKRYYRDRMPIVEQTGFEEVDISKNLVNNNVYYSGYFQSEKYIDSIKSSLKDIFKIKHIYEQQFVDKYASLFKNKKVLAIHYRIGDYAVWGGELLGGSNMVLPDSYYENALKLIPDYENYKVVLVTDDAKSAQAKLPFIKDKLVVSDQEILDFQVLMNADKLIISNSTFAWWAASLNKKNAEVFAPEFWIGFKVKKEYPVGIISSSFVKVAF
ncbi:alpha-1,2-fucosyltransferase [Hymenobacter sp. BT507]|uniref:Alpha-1,2-fucosyltransferase n=1 Tax=Hymenobacter citatus TaxID=2763506 RepID=A0ABR7ML17_9BACT|nr:alpha-1,2-fucosyltransferase [Hymenobacter citatus]